MYEISLELLMKVPLLIIYDRAESVTKGHDERSSLIYLRMPIDVPAGSAAQIWPQVP